MMQLQLTPEQEQKLHDFSAAAKDKAGQVSQKAQEIAQDVKERAEKMMSEIHPQDMVRDAGEVIKKHPLQSLAVGAVIGGLLGAALTRRGRRA
ncbi:MAG: DUF883 family protein [Candidatus Eremiobacteraeota bacterium]|nr:DUF883 family protein [Candidatus Eremiobacteraeota bacterium]MCW5866406.1 DUF883 family protein [Candidatus Eremiobacteraeota bacterium]